MGKTGSSEVPPTDPMPIDATDLMIILKTGSKWTSAKTYPELEAKMSKSVEAIPGLLFGFQYPVAMRFNELISGARQDVVCKIYRRTWIRWLRMPASWVKLPKVLKGTGGTIR